MGQLFHLVFAFLKIGTFVFGGGYGMIPFFYQEAVIRYHWLSQKEFIDAMAIGQITPGPIAMAGAFIGYRIYGLLGAVSAVISLCLPCFIMTIFATRQLIRFRENHILKGFLKGVSPAIAGLLISTAFTLSKFYLVNLKLIILAIAAFLAALRFKIDVIFLIIGCVIVGFLLL